MKIGIIGKGMVGGTMADGLTQIGHTVICHDPLKGLYNLDALLDATCIFVCVPTPTINNKCDTSIVEEVVSHLSQRNYEGVVAIKSTVIPGTTERLAKLFSNLTICFVPEFLKEKSALSDFIDHHDVLIVGTDDEAVFSLICQIHRSIPKTVKRVSPTEAEIAKYYNNIINSLKIVFANGMFDVCEALGADYQEVYDAVTLRNNVGKYYLKSSKEFRKFGGACLPKDLSAWAQLVDDLKLPNTIFSAIIKDNTL